MCDILTANDLDHVFLGKAEIVILQDNAFTFRIVHLNCRQIAHDCIHIISDVVLYAGSAEV